MVVHILKSVPLFKSMNCRNAEYNPVIQSSTKSSPLEQYKTSFLQFSLERLLKNTFMRAKDAHLITCGPDISKNYYKLWFNIRERTYY